MSGSVLCGVGKNHHGKTQVVVWDILKLQGEGGVSVLARANTEANIERMRISEFDESRLSVLAFIN